MCGANCAAQVENSAASHQLQELSFTELSKSRESERMFAGCFGKNGSYWPVRERNSDYLDGQHAGTALLGDRPYSRAGLPLACRKAVAGRPPPRQTGRKKKKQPARRRNSGAKKSGRSGPRELWPAAPSSEGRRGAPAAGSLLRVTKALAWRAPRSACRCRS